MFFLKGALHVFFKVPSMHGSAARVSQGKHSDWWPDHFWNGELVNVVIVNLKMPHLSTINKLLVVMMII